MGEVLAQRISIVIPVFQNEESIFQLFNELKSIHQLYFANLSLEVVFVEDGSSDKSWDVIEQIRVSNINEVASYKLTRNFGQLGAMLTGYEKATGDVVVSMSADLQDPANLVAEMVAIWKTGIELVIAHRADRKDGAIRSLTSRIAYFFARTATPNLPKGGFDYFLMSRSVLDSFLSMRGRHRFVQGDLLWLGYPTQLIPYTRIERPFGKSGYNWRKRLNNFIDLMIDSSYAPIRIMSRLGISVALAGFVYFVTILIAWIRGDAPFSGWAPIMALILVLNGFVMVMLGIIGEYIWRIHDHLRGKPNSVIGTGNPLS